MAVKQDNNNEPKPKRKKTGGRKANYKKWVALSKFSSTLEKTTLCQENG